MVFEKSAANLMTTRRGAGLGLDINGQKALAAIQPGLQQSMLNMASFLGSNKVLRPDGSEVRARQPTWRAAAWCLQVLRCLQCLLLLCLHACPLLNQVCLFTAGHAAAFGTQVTDVPLLTGVRAHYASQGYLSPCLFCWSDMQQLLAKALPANVPITTGMEFER